MAMADLSLEERIIELCRKALAADENDPRALEQLRQSLHEYLEQARGIATETLARLPKGKG
jgi:hypothetical protein